MEQQTLKQLAATAALQYIDDDAIIGVGSGTTVTCFIQALNTIKYRIQGCVASSVATAAHLKSLSIPLLDLNAVAYELAIYIDGADEINWLGEMIKGRGGAHTQEKIIATVAKQFICIVDETKQVQRLGRCPIPLEVLPLARSYVAREIVKLGGSPVYREHQRTDQNNIILDVYNLEIIRPMALEDTLKLIPGVIDSGLFAKRRADKVLIASAKGGVSTTIF